MIFFKSVVKLMRIHQWVKNLFVLLPLFFNRQLTDIAALSNCLLAALGFSLVTSSIYCFNDIYDIEADKAHPEKKNRPIASGAVSKPAAIGIMVICVLAGATIISVGGLSYQVLIVTGIYFVMNLAYTVELKHIAIIDAFIIAIGFVIRLFIGGYAAPVQLSNWIVTMTFLLALFMAFAKRRDDVVIFNATGIKTRKSITNYNLDFLNAALMITATITIVAYIMYSVADEVTKRFHTDKVYLTSLFVVAGVLRYLQITMVDAQSGSPTKILLKDRFIQLCILFWIALFAYIIY